MTDPKTANTEFEACWDRLLSQAGPLQLSVIQPFRPLFQTLFRQGFASGVIAMSKRMVGVAKELTDAS